MTIDAARTFETYVQTFPKGEMMQLKIDHTARVARDAQEVMVREGFSPTLTEQGLTAAWWHDVGRFPQLQQYGTFSDLKSVDHALLSCSEILRQGWLDQEDATTRNRILKAIAFHNLQEVPPQLEADDARVVHLVRDADKLDILVLLNQAIETRYLETHPEVYFGLPFTAPLSEGVVQALEAGKTVSYRDLKSLADFIFIQVSWCNGGFYFPASCALVLERNCLEIRRDYLCSILPASEHGKVIRGCEIAEAALKRKVSNGC